MFLNSLSLIAHVPLLSSNLPPQVNYFLMKYLNLVRLYSPELDVSIETFDREGSL
jgi:hypothetical protein